MYIIRSLQDFEALVDSRCLRDGEDFSRECVLAWNQRQRERGYSGYSDDMDQAVLPAGRWFSADVRTALQVWGANPLPAGPYIEQVRPEDKPALLRTWAYILENFDQIYENLLRALLPTLMEEGMESRNTGRRVTTVEQLHEARDRMTADGMEAACIGRLQLNCQYQRAGMVFYSLVFRPDCTEYGYDDGFEVVFWKDHVVSFLDGNTMDHIFFFEEAPYAVSFGPPPEED